MQQVNRPELVYNVKLLTETTGNLNVLLAPIISEIQTLLSKGKKAVVFYPTISELEESCDLFGNMPVVIVHSGLQDSERRAAIDRIHMGVAKIVLASTAFSMGIDVELDAVFHVGLAYSFISYVQECGRAGRSGNIATCTLVTSRGYLRKTKIPADSPDTTDFLNSYILNNQHCRRMLLNVNTSLSIIGMPCDMSNINQKCDVCCNQSIAVDAQSTTSSR